MSRKYLDIFLREAEEHLSALQKGLLRLEREPADAALIHDVLRNAHTLKGSARMLGYDDISSIAHRLEDLLKEIEDGIREVGPATVDILLRGADAIAALTGALSRGESSPLDVEQFLAALERGESPTAPAAEPQRQEEESLGETVRARVKTLDSLVNLIGELIINKKRFEEKVARLKGMTLDAGQAVPTTSVRDFQRELEEDVLYLDYLIQELHGEAMGLRMLPLRTITDGYQRMIRDLARDQGKEIEFEIVGDTVELDRVLLEALKPMLLHILTNAVDHGLETPDVRAERGKARRGTVRITARHEGESVRIDVRDDGRGMDPGAIRQVALRRGLIDREEAELLRDEEALYLTLRPGFSTSEIVTDLSGRGVGMDVVRQGIERIRGNLILRSEVGVFTEISLQLPVSLSVIEALLVDCGTERYAVPVTSIQETIKVRSEDIVTVGAREVVAVRGVTVPLVSLATMLGMPERQSLIETGKITAVILKLRDQTLACTVDRSLGNAEIVVKGLGGQFRRVEYVFGATILGDGSPALILNVPDLFASAEGASATGYREAFAATEAGKRRGSILVVDDSITTRTMERSILVSHGYQVEIAVSGEDALGKVEGFRYDLVISDVEMPGINGFELTRRLRGREEYRDVPVIIVSSLSRDEDKRQALEAGAQAYIVKGSFDQGTLLDTVETLIG